MTDKHKAVLAELFSGARKALGLADPEPEPDPEPEQAE
jgi:hypothetical protein